MNVYIYQADVWCAVCAKKIIQELIEVENIPENVHNEATYDSDNFPKGPYPEGGGEADTPQHCAGCKAFLKNPLTSEGEKYVLDLLGEEDDPVVRLPPKGWQYDTPKHSKRFVEWIDRYSYLWKEV